MEIIIGILIFGLIGAAIGQTRGRTDAGFLWSVLLGPIGWLIVLLGPNPKKEKEEEARRSQEVKMQKMQEAHLSELRALRATLESTGKNAAVKEDLYWVRLKDRVLGPIEKIELLELFSSGTIVLDTQVAHYDDADTKVWRALSDEVPALRRSQS